MKRFLSGLVMLLISISAICQVPVQVNEKMFVGFQREDGIFVIYDAKGIVSVQDDKFAVRLETTDLKLTKFLAITDFYNTLDEARAKLGLPPVTEENPKVENKGDWGAGQYRVQYGTTYNDYIMQLAGGSAVFDFLGQDVVYPAFNSTSKPSTDELVVVDFPTHSIINYAGTDFRSAIEMRLYDMNNKLIWYLNDSKSGYHPCVTGKDCDTQLRGNNHPDDAARWLKYGHYYLTVNNQSSDKRAVQSIWWGTTSGIQFFDYDIEAGGLQTFDLYVNKLGNEYDAYKLNCNVFTPR